MIDLFIAYIYQPFFNILIGIYYALGVLTDGQPDMGIAVVVFSLVVRLVMLPLTLSADRSEDDKKKISASYKELRSKYKDDPIKLRSETRALFKNHPIALISEGITIFIQVIIVLMLYRIFSTGLGGADYHLIYPFMPRIVTPINLLFLGEYDLTHPSLFLNLVQTFLIFAFESLHMLFSPAPSPRKDFISLAIFLPITSFLIFSLMPSGKKLFIITSLSFSVLLLLVKQVLFWYHSLLGNTTKSPKLEQ